MRTLEKCAGLRKNFGENAGFPGAEGFENIL